MLDKDQVRALIEMTKKKKADALAEYNRLTGFINALSMFDGSIEITPEEGNDGKKQGNGSPVAGSGGECES